MEEKLFDLGEFYLYHFNRGLEERKQNGRVPLFREGYPGLFRMKFWEEKMGSFVPRLKAGQTREETTNSFLAALRIFF